MFGALDTSTSALVAQRQRLTIIAGNMANRFSVYDPDGNVAPYQRRIPVFAPGDPGTGSERGVHITEIALDDRPPRKVFEPGHPAADPDGYVHYPDIDPSVEMVNAIEATRAYEANIAVAEATKSMMQTSMRLLG